METRKINDWHIDDGMTATFETEDFERWWLHGFDRDDAIGEGDIDELVENCIYLATMECREMTQSLEELKGEIERWAAKWNDNVAALDVDKD
jgi:hypothetical protein